MKKSLLFLAVLISIQAFARDTDRPMKPGPPHWTGNERSERPGRFQWTRPTFGGNGCPDGSMQLVFAPDNLSFTLIFDKFVAQTTAAAPAGAVTCNTLVPMTIPDNQQLEITRVDLRGFVGLPAGSRATLHSSFNFRGPGGDRDRINLNYSFQGPYTDNYLISTDAMNESGAPSTSEVSPCGGQAWLAINTQLIAQSRTGDASITLDSVDGSSHAIYYLNWRSCTPQGNPGKPGGPGDPGDHGRPDRPGGPGRPPGPIGPPGLRPGCPTLGTKFCGPN